MFSRKYMIKRLLAKTFAQKLSSAKKYMEIIDLLTWCLEDKVSYCRLAPVVGEVTVE